MRDLIQEYFATIAPSVARSTLPHSDHLLVRHVQTQPYTLQLLKALIPEQLAAILVDRHRIVDEWTFHRYGIPAEEAFGDALRDRVARGWRVFGTLSKISHEVHRMDALKSRTNFAQAVLHPSRYKLEVLKQKEDLIFQKRMDYLDSLLQTQAQDYKLMFILLSSAFSTSISNIGSDFEPWPFDFGNGIDGQRALRKGESWLSWYLLAEGPDIFWKQWWSLPPNDPVTKNLIRDHAIAAFKNTPEKLADHQRSLGWKFQQAVNDTVSLRTGFDGLNPVRYFTQYAEHKLRGEQAGTSPSREIMDHVPFLINFRCPDEVMNNHREVAQERDAARSIVSIPR
jgi:hypothetical protein